MEVGIVSPLHRTEDPEKVKKAITNIFPDCALEEKEHEIAGKSPSLERFREILRDLRIRDTARHFLTGKIEGDRISFSISKQAAYMGKISFGGTNPALGEIEIEIMDGNPDRLIEWLTYKGE